MLKQPYQVIPELGLGSAVNAAPVEKDIKTELGFTKWGFILRWTSLQKIAM